MKYPNRLLFSALLCLAAPSAFSQIVCPTNIDFEAGTGSWNYYIGTCCPLTATTSTAPIACRHTLTSSSGLVGCTGTATGATDQYGGFSVVAPGGGSHSLRIGDNVNGALAEKARMYIPVPTGGSYCIVYRYAIVLQDPNSSHSPAQMPRFEVDAFDSASGTPVTGAHHTYIPGAGIPGFISNTTCTTCSPPATAGGPVVYKDWATATIDLSGLGGHTVALDFATGDCQPGGHFGYAYVDPSCGLFEVGSIVPCDTSWAEVTALPGYASYAWYDSATFSTSYGTGISTWVPVGAGDATYAVVLHPYPGFGPDDTLYTTLTCGACFSGAPSAGVAAPSVASACITTPITLSDAGFTLVTVGLQWQSSADSVSWTNIPGATTVPYTFTGISATTYYRLVVSCSLSGLTTQSAGTKITYVPCSTAAVPVTKFNNILLSPNPATDELLITTETGAFSSFIITNSVGQQVLQQNIYSAETKVSLKNLPAGTYYVALSGEQGSEVRRFLKK